MISRPFAPCTAADGGGPTDPQDPPPTPGRCPVCGALNCKKNHDTGGIG